MQYADRRPQDAQPSRDRLSRLSAASLRINESLDLGDVLQGVLDSARALTDARYALITTLDDSGQVDDFLVAGLTEDEARLLWVMPGGLQLIEYLSALPAPLRVADFAAHTRSLGLPEFLPPVPTSSFLAVPIRHRGVSMGNIHVSRDETGREFTKEDEETLVMFASQAALVIANARRHREEQRARAGLETLIETSPVGVVVIDFKKGAAVSFNPEARRIVNALRDPGQAPEDLLGLITVRRADGNEFSLQEFPLARVLGDTETVRAEEIVMAAPDGRSVTVLLNATPIRSHDGDGDGDGEVESVVVTMQDMAAVEEQERLRAEFLGMVSHELRMPLTSILGSVTAMLEGTTEIDPAVMRQFLRIILDQVGSMRTLIDDLLDVARIETGALPVDPEPAEVGTLVDRARNAYTSAGGRNHLAIEIEPDLPLVLADRRRIVQVIGNLLSNAARHSPEDSVIQVSAVREGGHVEVSVSDQGRGIPAGDLPLLFRRFSRREDRDAGGDTGLGLAICKGIVEAHGGRIRAESDGPGLGARFAFTLPVVAEAEPARRPSRSQDSVQSAGTVLVVDDDPLILRSVRDALATAGFPAVVTADPEEALALLGEHSPHLAILDLMLPERDGEELMEDILAVSRIPVIFLSAYGKDDVVARVLEKGATDYIVKPFSHTELVARVRAALRRFGEEALPEPEQSFVLGELRIDYAARKVTVSGNTAELTPMEFDLLAALSKEAGRVVPHDRLLRRMWSPGKPGKPGKPGNLRALRTHLKLLRRKLGDDAANPTYIFAEPRVGYRMPAGETDKPAQE